jgi:hypothetical protein
MWVYIKSQHGDEPLWTVGFYGPDGKWQPESDHANSEDAAERCHWLNGGHTELGQLSEGVR